MMIVIKSLETGRTCPVPSERADEKEDELEIDPHR
jgi:hypothetical protein